MEKIDPIRRMEAGEFRKNNGRVLCTINILKSSYVHLDTIRYALSELTESDIIKSVNFLELEQYIKIREIDTKEPASISDFNLDQLEAKLSGKGIRLLSGSLTDDDVKV